jgi:hypothetical protein
LPIHFSISSNDIVRSTDYVIESEIEVEIYEIDVVNGEALINIKVRLRNETLSYPTIVFLISGGGFAEFPCYKTTYPDQYYEGQSGKINWKIRSFGEFFPYDFYQLHFWIQQIWRRNDSETLSFEEKANVSESTCGRIYPSENSEILLESWYTIDDLAYVPKYVLSERKFYLQISRNPSNITNVFQFILPLLAAYAILGATMAIDSEDKLNERLTIYLALFAFSPTFWFSIQRYLPFHTSLTIPEFAVANLIISVAIFGFFSLISQMFKKHRIFADGIAISLSGIAFALLYWHLYINKFVLRGLHVPLEVSITLLAFEFFAFILGALYLGIRLKVVGKFYRIVKLHLMKHSKNEN